MKYEERAPGKRVHEHTHTHTHTYYSACNVYILFLLADKANQQNIHVSA